MSPLSITLLSPVWNLSCLNQERIGMNFFTKKSVITDHKIIFWPKATVYGSYKHSSLHKMLIDWLESYGLLWWFYQLFGLSLWRHPFTAMVSKWHKARFIQICSDGETKSLTWPEGEYISSKFSFLGKLFIKCCLCKQLTRLWNRATILQDTQ